MIDQGLVLLTGATGFVGAHLARTLLSRGYRVRVLVRESSDRRNIEGLDVERSLGDLRDEASLARGLKGVRWLVHAAADYRLHVPDPDAMTASNVDGTRRLLELAGEAGVEKIVYTSSVATVPVREDGLPADESRRYAGPDGIVSLYKRTKFLAEEEALLLADKGLPVVIVNPAAPIGPYDRKPTPTGRMVLDFLNGRMPAYLDTGLNVVHAEDAAIGHLLALERGRPGERYILGGENLTMKTILDILSEATGLPSPRLRLPWPAAYAIAWVDTNLLGFGGREPRAPLDGVRMARRPMFFDSAKARRELGHRPRPAREALRDAAAWFAANGMVRRPLPRLRGEKEAAGGLTSADAPRGAPAKGRRDPSSLLDPGSAL